MKNKKLRIQLSNVELLKPITTQSLVDWDVLATVMRSTKIYEEEMVFYIDTSEVVAQVSMYDDVFASMYMSALADILRRAGLTRIDRFLEKPVDKTLYSHCINIIGDRYEEVRQE